MITTDYEEYKDWRALKLRCSKSHIQLPEAWSTFKGFFSEVGCKPTKQDKFKYIDKNTWGWFTPLPKQNKEYPEYSNWKNMRARCSAPCLAEIRNYQRKGITVSKEWDSFQQFYLDMGPKPTSKHSIERLDNSKGYNKSNCIWADDVTQARNTSKVKTFTANGITGCVPELAEHFNINSNAIHKNMQRGLTADEAVTKLLYQKDKYKNGAILITYKNHSLTKPEWAKFLGVPKSTLYARFRNYGSLAEVFKPYDIV